MDKIIKMDKEFIWVSCNDNQVIKYPISAYNGKKPKVGEDVNILKGQNGEDDIIQPIGTLAEKNDKRKEDMEGCLGCLVLVIIAFVIWSVMDCGNDKNKDVKTNLSKIDELDVNVKNSETKAPSKPNIEELNKLVDPKNINEEACTDFLGSWPLMKSNEKVMEHLKNYNVDIEKLKKDAISKETLCKGFFSKQLIKREGEIKAQRDQCEATYILWNQYIKDPDTFKIYLKSQGYADDNAFNEGAQKMLILCKEKGFLEGKEIKYW